jgi:DNA-directed RNA polymerase specialized sigma24 family protein
VNTGLTQADWGSEGALLKTNLIDRGSNVGGPVRRGRNQRTTPAGEDLTGDDFEKLLIWLGPGRDQAGRAYEQIRSRLINLFLRHEYAAAEELADETINRVIRSVHRIADSFVGDPMVYFYAVARRLRFERQRRPVVVTWEETHHPVCATVDEVSDEYDRKLERAMNMLPATDRELIVRYYQGEGRGKIDHRQRLAEELGIGLNALRIRVHRIRMELKRQINL